MTIKKVITGDEARLGLLKGMEVVAKTVGATAGAAGRNVAVANQWGSPSLTKDGYKTSKSIDLAGIEEEGVKLIQQAAEKQNSEAGDATTLVTTLTYEVAKEGVKLMEKGCNATQLKKGIDEASKDLVQYLKEMSKPVTTNDEVKQIATISANGDEVIGSLIAEAVEKVGKTGVITAEDSKNFDTTLEVAEGLQFDQGYLSPYFVTNPEKSTAEYDNPKIFITDYKINSLKQILPMLESVCGNGQPLIIISDELSQEALAAIVVNHIQGRISCCAVKAPSFGDFRTMELEDIAILTGGKFISEKMGVSLEKVDETALGSCKKIKIYPNKTVIIGGLGDKEAVGKRVQELQDELSNSESKYDKEKLQERVAKLTGGVAVIKVGGASEVEINEKKDRVDDAICSTKSALEEGILPGGGVSLVRAYQKTFEVEKTVGNADIARGYNLMRQAVLKQVVNLANNAGVSGDVVLDVIIQQKDRNIGYNLLTGKYEDMFKAGIVDATKCIRLAVETSASVAGSLLTTESVVIPDIDEAIKMAKLTSASSSSQY